MVYLEAIQALTEPFEPGSTLKPFIAAALLSRRRASLSERIDVLGGEYTVHGRTLRDVHRSDEPMTLGEVIRHSSNVGIVRFAERLSHPHDPDPARTAIEVRPVDRLAGRQQRSRQPGQHDRRPSVHGNH